MPSRWHTDVQEMYARDGEPPRGGTTPPPRPSVVSPADGRYSSADEWAVLFNQGRDQWNRFVIHAPTHGEAAHIAANLSWWLHCWTWEPYPHGTYIIDAQPE